MMDPADLVRLRAIAAREWWQRNSEDMLDGMLIAIRALPLLESLDAQLKTDPAPPPGPTPQMTEGWVGERTRPTGCCGRSECCDYAGCNGARQWHFTADCPCPVHHPIAADAVEDWTEPQE